MLKLWVILAAVLCCLPPERGQPDVNRSSFLGGLGNDHHFRTCTHHTPLNMTFFVCADNFTDAVPQPTSVKLHGPGAVPTGFLTNVVLYGVCALVVQLIYACECCVDRDTNFCASWA